MAPFPCGFRWETVCEDLGFDRRAADLATLDPAGADPQDDRKKPHGRRPESKQSFVKKHQKTFFPPHLRQPNAPGTPKR